jgi:hypothetical protein
MTALTGTEKSRISRERAKLGLVQLIAWVPADKLTACKDAIAFVTKGETHPAPYVMLALDVALKYIESDEREDGFAFTEGEIIRAAIAKAKGETNDA